MKNNRLRLDTVNFFFLRKEKYSHLNQTSNWYQVNEIRKLNGQKDMKFSYICTMFSQEERRAQNVSKVQKETSHRENVHRMYSTLDLKNTRSLPAKFINSTNFFTWMLTHPLHMHNIPFRDESLACQLHFLENSNRFAKKASSLISCLYMCMLLSTLLSEIRHRTSVCSHMQPCEIWCTVKQKRKNETLAHSIPDR